MLGISGRGRFSVILNLALVLCTSAVSIAAERKPAPSLGAALIEVRNPLGLSGEKLSGTGAEVLSKAVVESRFVLIGEDHITREIPRFASALCDVMHPDAYAVEVGPEAAEFVSGLLRSPERIARMAARMKSYPNNMAFLDIREENDSAAHCAAASRNPEFRLWGLDQEFVGAAGTLLDAMAESHPGPKSRAAIIATQTMDQAADQQARVSGDPGNAFLLASTDAQLLPLTEAIASDGNIKTRTLLSEFMASREIYRLNSVGSPDSNRVRAELFKQHFLADYSSAKAQLAKPRVLFKFGDNHMAKGFSILHVRDIGNFVAELADGEKAKTLHILVLGVNGTHATFGGYAKPYGREPFVMTEDPGYQWIAPAVSGLLPQQEGSDVTTLTLFDLRKLRFRGIEMPREWERIIYGYDLFVLMPELTPASQI